MKLSGFEVHIETCKDFSEGYTVQSDDEEEEKHDTVDAEIRQFFVPQINLKAKAYYQLTKLNEVCPAVVHLSDGDIKHIREIYCI